MKFNRKIFALLLSMLLALTLFGCGESSAGRAERIENAELIAAIGEEPETGFDSTTGSHGSLTKLFFSTLFRRDKALGWEGDLASGYTVSEDRLSWRVTLREDAFFTDGTPVTAEDVAYTYMTAKESGSDIDLTIINDVSALDTHTVEFRLNRVYSPFIERMAYLGIIPKHAHGSGFAEAPIGSGPYKLVSWDRSQQIIAEANENYYGEAPKIKKLTLVFLGTDAAYAALAAGSIDVAQINGALADRTTAGAGVINLDSIECYGVCFPMVPDEGKTAADGAGIGNDVTSDLSIRKALNIAVDRKKMVSGILNGYGTVSTTGLEQMPWLNESTVMAESEYADLDKAKAVLAEGGWKDSDGDGVLDKNGVAASFELLYTDGVYRQELGLEFANVAAQLGIKVTLRKTTWDTILPDIHKQAVLYGFGSGDPSELYNLYYGGIAGGAVAWDNSGCYANESCDKLIDSALLATDEAEALPYWQALQQYASASGDAPYCWLVNVNHVYLAADGFSFGQPVVQPHGGRIFDNVTEWCWE